MKKGFVFLLICALVAAGWFCWPKPGPTAQADSFLRFLALGQVDQAYALTTAKFRLIASKGELLVKSQRLGLDQFAAADWNIVSRPHPSTVNLEADATLADGGVVHLEMRMRVDEGGWKVDLMGKSRGDAILPEDTGLNHLVQTTMLDLSQAIVANDFATFREKSSRSLQLMNTEEELLGSFARIDYSFVKELAPQFHPKPAVDGQGNLQLIGHYATSPSRMEFLMNFTYEKPDWRLTALQIHLVDVYEKQAEQFVNLLARSEFARAYRLTSAEFRKNADEAKLKQVASQLQLAADALPKWTNQDSRDDLVMLDGKVSTRSGKDVDVRVGMILENSAWKVHYLR